MPFSLLGVVAFLGKSLQEARRFANFDEETVMSRLGGTVGVVHLRQLAFEYGSGKGHDKNVLGGILAAYWWHRNSVWNAKKSILLSLNMPPRCYLDAT